MTKPSRLITAFQNTFAEIEKEERLKGDDAALRELKNSVARSIAELEVKKDARRDGNAGAVAQILQFPGAVKGAVFVKKRRE